LIAFLIYLETMKILYLSLLMTAFLTLPTSPASAGAETNAPTTTNEPTLNPINSTSPLSQQVGFIQNNNGTGTLGIPNCTGTCLFTLIKVIPTSGSTTVEASVGAIWQLSSPENIQAQAYKIRADAERENLATQTDIGLVEKLSMAMESNKLDLANAIAILLAKRWGYSDYHQLVRDVRNRGATSILSK
jgi:hypothetical protein